MGWCSSFLAGSLGRLRLRLLAELGPGVEPVRGRTDGSGLVLVLVLVLVSMFYLIGLLCVVHCSLVTCITV